MREEEDKPDSMFARMRAARDSMDLPLPEPTLLDGGEVIEVGGREFEMIWTPGHTEGHLCVLDRGTDALFTGDHLLARITPHIGMWPDETRSPLPQFEESLGLVAKLNPTLALPAHERIIDHPAERAGEILEHHQDRRQHILDAVDGGDRSAFAMSRSPSSPSAPPTGCSSRWRCPRRSRTSRRWSRRGACDAAAPTPRVSTGSPNLASDRGRIAAPLASGGARGADHGRC